MDGGVERRWLWRSVGGKHDRSHNDGAMKHFKLLYKS
jgi:hypothetical protein